MKKEECKPVSRIDEQPPKNLNRWTNKHVLDKVEQDSFIVHCLFVAPGRRRKKRTLLSLNEALCSLKWLMKDKCFEKQKGEIKT